MCVRCVGGPRKARPTKSERSKEMHCVRSFVHMHHWRGEGRAREGTVLARLCLRHIHIFMCSATPLALVASHVKRAPLCSQRRRRATAFASPRLESRTDGGTDPNTSHGHNHGQRPSTLSTTIISVSLSHRARRVRHPTRATARLARESARPSAAGPNAAAAGPNAAPGLRSAQASTVDLITYYRGYGPVCPRSFSVREVAQDLCLRAEARADRIEVIRVGSPSTTHAGG